MERDCRVFQTSNLKFVFILLYSNDCTAFSEAITLSGLKTFSMHDIDAIFIIFFRVYPYLGEGW